MKPCPEQLVMNVNPPVPRSCLLESLLPLCPFLLFPVAFQPCCFLARSSESFFSIPAVANVIDENIKLCRRLIVLVAPESSSFRFLKGMSEEQIAVYNALIQDGMKVILIELEKIEDYSTMPESIQYIRQKHGAIQWHGDFTEQSQCAKTKFWKKVRYHMPRRRYPPSSSVRLLRHTPCNGMTGKWDAATELMSP